MFTGLIEEVGVIQSRGTNALTILCTKIQKDLARGDSVAVNGVCLTIIHFDRISITAEIMPVTLGKTNLGALRISDSVHLERAMRFGDRVGGHLVAGHVDVTTRVLSVKREGTAVLVTLALPESCRSFIIPTGSIAVDGVSLTVAALDETNFTVSLVGHTRDNTFLATRSFGEEVNLECDQIGKYVHRQLQAAKEERPEGISPEMLLREGFM